MTRPAAARRAAAGLGVALFFVALTVWILDFRLGYLGSRLPGGLGDPVLSLYFMEWGGRSLAHGLRGFWDANFYFPATGVMTMSDHLLGPAALVAVFRLLWNNAVAAYDLLFLGSYVLSGAATAWVLRRNGASAAPAMLAGIMFAFSPYRSSQEPHLQVLLMQWIPLTLWWWDRLLGRPGLANAAWFTLFYVLHVTGGNYLAYLIHFALVIVLLEHAREWRSLVSWRSLRAVAPAMIVGGAVTLSLFAPYLAARRERGLERVPTEVAFYGASPGSYFSIERENELWGGLLRHGRPENRLFAGAVTMLFAGAGALLLLRRGVAGRKAPAPQERAVAAPQERSAPAPQLRSLSTWERGVLWSGLFFFLLSFSPIFLALARILRGLSSMRAPTRGYPFVSLALVVLAARGIDWALARVPRRRTLVTATIGAVLCLELDAALSWLPWPDPPERLGIFHEIARRPEVRAVVHLPMLADAREAHYMYYSTLHWKPIANGYSGFAPATYVELHRRLDLEPLADSTLDYLLELGVTHVATHPFLLKAPRGRRRLARWEGHWSEGPSPRLRLVATAGADRLYQLLPRAGAGYAKGVYHPLRQLAFGAEDGAGPSAAAAGAERASWAAPRGAR